MNIPQIWSELEAYVLDLIHRTEARGCRVINTGTQNIPNATPTAVSFNTEVFDTDSGWEVGAPTKLFARRDGYYMAGGAWGMAAAQNTAASLWNAGIRINGTTYPGLNSLHSVVGKSGFVAVATGMFWMSDGDYIELTAFQDEGAAKTISAASTAEQYSCNAWLMRVG